MSQYVFAFTKVSFSTPDFLSLSGGLQPLAHLSEQNSCPFLFLAVVIGTLSRQALFPQVIICAIIFPLVSGFNPLRKNREVFLFAVVTAKVFAVNNHEPARFRNRLVARSALNILSFHIFKGSKSVFNYTPVLFSQYMKKSGQLRLRASINLIH